MECRLKNDHNFCFPMTNEPITRAYVETKGTLFPFQIKLECLSDPIITDDEENLEEIEMEESNDNSSSFLSQSFVLIYFIYFCL